MEAIFFFNNKKTAPSVPENTAIANAKNPFEMAQAFKMGVVAGRKSFLAGRITKTLYGNPSSPKKGII